MIKIRNLFLYILTIFFILTVFWGCAEVVAPPGGEVDKTKPSLLGSDPPNGAVQIPLGNEIEIFFSERINPPRTGTGLFISPKPAVLPKVKWKSDRVIVQLADSFETNKTYVITVASSITDLRNNPLDSGVTIAFSTGDQIDSGTVSGKVMNGAVPVQGMLVALFETDLFDSTTIFDSVTADYMIQTNSHGYFKLSYLPSKSYRMVAFEDRNQDERFNPFSEPFALPDREINIGDSLIPKDDLFMPFNRQDSASLAIRSVQIGSDKMVVVTLTQEIDVADYLSKKVSLELEDRTSSGRKLKGDFFLEQFEEKSHNLTFYLPDLTKGDYRAYLTLDGFYTPLAVDSISYFGSDDKLVPTILKITPDSIPALPGHDNIRLLFSEPIDSNALTSETFSIWVDSLTQLEMEIDWPTPFVAVISNPTLQKGGEFELRVTEFEIIDQSGNSLGDSLYVHNFSITDPDSLGSASGTYAIDLSDRQSAPVILNFLNYENGQVITKQFDLSEWKIDLPAGKYEISGFVDADGDGKYGKGSIVPYQLSESFQKFADTVKVRARFQTSDIKLEFK